MQLLHHLARMSEGVAATVAAPVTPHCPACGQPIDHCPGHGLVGDPVNYHALVMHDSGHHILCHPAGCEEAT